MSRVGTLIATRYHLLQLIDQGAMGEVYIARDIRLKTIVAVKFLKHTLHRPEMCDRFLREATVCAQLSSQSDYIVPVMDFGTDPEDIPFLVMKYLQGLSLQQYLAAQPLSLSHCLRWLEQICLGLQCAHAGIELEPGQPRDPVIHCDIKPSNIFLTPHETLGAVIKILDFGVARLVEADNQIGVFAGTFPYCSPEQMQGDRLDPRSDIYSLGILMFEMLTRQRPFQSRSNHIGVWQRLHREQIPPPLTAFIPPNTIPQPLEDLVMACLAKTPEQRPPAIAEVLEVIRLLLNHQPSGVIANLPILLNAAKAMATNLATLQTTVKTPPVLLFPPELVRHSIACQPVSNPERMPALWIKLPHELIQTIQIYRFYTEIYQHFLFCQPPQHPMLLWITAIANPQFGVRWFACSLDLKTRSGTDLMYLLGQCDTYQYLFFEATSPYWLAHQITMPLDPERRKHIQRAVIAIQTQRSIGTAIDSQHHLQSAYLNLKLQKEPELLKRVQQKWTENS